MITPTMMNELLLDLKALREKYGESLEAEGIDIGLIGNNPSLWGMYASDVVINHDGDCVKNRFAPVKATQTTESENPSP